MDARKSLWEMYKQTGDEEYLKLAEDTFGENGYANLLESERLSNAAKKKIALELEDVTKDQLLVWVKIFYDLQDYRKAARERIRSNERIAAEKSMPVMSEFNELILKNAVIMEKNIYDIFEALTLSTEIGRWLVNTKGIGPVLAANLIGTFDVTRANYAGGFISFSGLNDQNRPWLGSKKSEDIVNRIIEEKRQELQRDKIREYCLQNSMNVNWDEFNALPVDEIWVRFGDSKASLKAPKKVPLTEDIVERVSAETQWKMDVLRKHAYDEEKEKWDKKKLVNACARVPYSRPAKTLMYLTGQSFVWCSNRGSLYGRLYQERRALEVKKNENGELAEAAAKELATKNYDKTTKAYAAYSQGKLPDTHLTMRAMRIAEKIFLCHLFEEMYRLEYKKPAPLPYQFEHMEGHHNIIEPEVPYTEV